MSDMKSTSIIKNILECIQTDYPDIIIKKAHKSWWDGSSRTIYYDPSQNNVEWSLLHELGHMLANHTNYLTDVQLLQMEVEAWENAKKIAEQYEIAIDQEHIEDCIDSYRDWLHKRSTCPDCHQTGLQDKERLYRCHNCGKKWSVSESRFCRPYRKKQNAPQ
jgi:hypothetical protein